MKKALFLTDGSVDTALSLNNWLEAQSESIDLTVVYAFTLPQTTDQPLNAATYQQAKQKATQQLAQWLDFLPHPCPALDWPGQLHAESLPGDPVLVLTIHLLLRRYDYLVIDRGQRAALSAFIKCQGQITTKLCSLSPSEYPLREPELPEKIEGGLPTNGVINEIAGLNY